MMRLALSSAASALLRALIERASCPRDQVLLVDWRSTDWQSLTYVGERHCIGLRLCGPGAADACSRMTDGIEDAEFALPGNILADIAVSGAPDRHQDGSISITMEALTIAE